MKMKEFVEIINIQLKEFPSQDIKSIYDLESSLFILSLREILAKYQNDESNISKKTLDSFIKLLEDRWNRILNSDAIEQYNPNSPANRISRVIAKNMGVLLSLPAAKFLMPTLEKTETSDNNKSLLDLPAQQFVLSDDNKVVIEIYPCFENSRSLTKAKNKTPAEALAHTARGLSKGNNRKELSETERLRVINHSEATKEFFKNYVDCTIDQLKTLKTTLKKQLDSADYHALPAHGKPGKQRLRVEIYKDVKTREDLFKKLSGIPKELWKPYCEHMKANDFVSIMTNGKFTASDVLSGKVKIDAILQEQDFLTGDSEKDRCRLFCLFAFYEKVREKDAYHHNMFGYLARPFVYTKAHKIPAVEQMMAEILNIESIDSIPAKLADVGSELYKHQGALKNSDLGKFTDFTLQHINKSVVKNVEVPVTVPQASM